MYVCLPVWLLPSSAMARDPGDGACTLYGSREDKAAVTAIPALVTLYKRNLPAEAGAWVGDGNEAAMLREAVSPRPRADASMDAVD